LVFADEFIAQQWVIVLVEGGSETSAPVEEDMLGAGVFYPISPWHMVSLSK